MKQISNTNFEAWKNFIRYKTIATGLLLVMGAITFFGYMLPYYGILQNSFWVDLLRTGCQAGFIGACADWFAVTALFRHPLGIPIPHTAILPKQQKRLGYGLGYFVAQYVFTKEEISSLMRKVDFPSLLGKYIVDPDTLTMITSVVLNSVPEFLNHWEKGNIKTIINRIINRLLNGEEATPLISRALQVLVDNSQHQEVISFILSIIQRILREKEQNLRSMIHSRVKEQGGRFVGWMIGDSIATKVLSAINKELERIDPHNTELREQIGEWVKHEISKIEENPERMKKIAKNLNYFLKHEIVQDWKDIIWQRLRSYIEEDIQKDDGWFRNIIQDSLFYFSERLEKDKQIRYKFTQTLKITLIKFLPFMQEWIIHFTESVISNWDNQALTDRLEYRIGKDLQYIRINGSIVGFLIGIVLYLLLYFCFGSKFV